MRFRHLLLSRELALLHVDNLRTFRSDILAQPWDDLKGVHNPNEMWLKWKTLFLEVSLTHYLSNLKQWLDSNRLSLNVLKTKCLFTGTRYKISLLPIELYISVSYTHLTLPTTPYV